MVEKVELEESEGGLNIAGKLEQNEAALNQSVRIYSLFFFFLTYRFVIDRLTYTSCREQRKAIHCL